MLECLLCLNERIFFCHSQRENNSIYSIIEFPHGSRRQMGELVFGISLFSFVLNWDDAMNTNTCTKTNETQATPNTECIVCSSSNRVLYHFFALTSAYKIVTIHTINNWNAPLYVRAIFLSLFLCVFLCVHFSLFTELDALLISFPLHSSRSIFSFFFRVRNFSTDFSSSLSFTLTL